jgi:hypothetical protein
VGSILCAAGPNDAVAAGSTTRELLRSASIMIFIAWLPL